MPFSSLPCRCAMYILCRCESTDCHPSVCTGVLGPTLQAALNWERQWRTQWCRGGSGWRADGGGVYGWGRGCQWACQPREDSGIRTWPVGCLQWEQCTGARKQRREKTASCSGLGQPIGWVHNCPREHSELTWYSHLHKLSGSRSSQ